MTLFSGGLGRHSQIWSLAAFAAGSALLGGSALAGSALPIFALRTTDSGARATGFLSRGRQDTVPVAGFVGQSQVVSSDCLPGVSLTAGLGASLAAAVRLGSLSTGARGASRATLAAR